MDKDFRISDVFQLTLVDLGRKGCLNYVFNQASRERVDELLRVASQPPFNQEQAVKWLTMKCHRIGTRSLKHPLTPLEIAATQKDSYGELMEFINREINFCGVN